MSELGEKIKTAREAKGLTQAQLADAVRMSQQSIGEIEIGNVTSPRKWSEIAEVLSIPREEMRRLVLSASRGAQKQRNSRDPELEDRPTARLRGPAEFAPRQIPVYGQAVGGAMGEYIFNGEAVDWKPCPPSLASVSNAYAVFVDGESMVPRYDPRDTVWVHPSRPAKPGEDVIVQIRAKNEGDPPHGFIKKFDGWAGNKLRLSQFNPPKAITFDRDEVVSVHPVVFVERG
jgi:phage repressor protein C with HTH and peptisase S24 domain